MPTGYTASVADGTVTDLEPFVLQLARGMGALIMMRDDPANAPIPEAFEPSDYSTKKLAELRAERDRLYDMSDAEAQIAADAEYAEKVAYRAKREAKHGEQRQRYEAMIRKVRAWTGAPEGIKEFGIEQLERGMDFDCALPFKHWDADPVQTTGPAWRQAALVNVAKDIEYHAAEEAKEIARTDSRNAWIVQLRKSLAPQ